MVCPQWKAPPLQRENFILHEHRNTWVLSVFGTTYADLKASQIRGSTLLTRHAITATTTLSISADRKGSVPVSKLSPWPVNWFPVGPTLSLYYDPVNLTLFFSLKGTLDHKRTHNSSSGFEEFAITKEDVIFEEVLFLPWIPPLFGSKRIRKGTDPFDSLRRELALPRTRLLLYQM
ncbi:hypothetical protein M9H77_23549 [Catharanthus roseus]|uniref:Uncharacterized protein n=1 Tax=Catharanthus roseus TaxID=4058 RepID=A0ACC0AU16_CATRO|nr:hypothetical protein M9H77_23549 [Catharanthus roseus]